MAFGGMELDALSSAHMRRDALLAEVAWAGKAFALIG